MAVSDFKLVANIRLVSDLWLLDDLRPVSKCRFIDDRRGGRRSGNGLCVSPVSVDDDDSLG